MEKPRNPFILGPKINRPYFCDREREQASLTSAVINGRNVVLMSPRRMGKTALINITLDESPLLKEQYYSFFIDILQTSSLQEFTYLLGKAIFDALLPKGQNALRNFLAALKSLKGCFGFDPFTGTPTFNLQLGDIHQPEYTLVEIFRYIEESDRPVIVAIDEFQQITNYPEKNVEAILRSHIQHLSNATFIFAGSERSILEEMFVSSKRPFYNSSELMHLAPIPEDIYAAFARRIFHDRDRDIDLKAIHGIFHLFGGNTFYMQRTMNGSFAKTPEGGYCTASEVEHVLREMIASNETIYREILANISGSQKALLYAVAQEKSASNIMSGAFIRKYALASPSSVQSAVKKLIERGLVTKDETAYSLTDPLLRIFINEIYFQSEINLMS